MIHGILELTLTMQISITDIRFYDFSPHWERKQTLNSFNKVPEYSCLFVFIWWHQFWLSLAFFVANAWLLRSWCESRNPKRFLLSIVPQINSIFENNCCYLIRPTHLITDRSNSELNSDTTKPMMLWQNLIAYWLPKHYLVGRLWSKIERKFKLKTYFFTEFAFHIRRIWK